MLILKSKPTRFQFDVTTNTVVLGILSGFIVQLHEWRYWGVGLLKLDNKSLSNFWQKGTPSFTAWSARVT